MSIAIASIGIASPAYRRAQLETADLIVSGLNLRPAEKRLLKSVYKSTGIEFRHSVLSDYCKQAGEFEFFPNNPQDAFPTTAKRMQIYKDNALPLALSAISNCFAELNNFNLSDITHVITISCTGMYAPGLDIEIVQQLKLMSTTKRTAINFMGCYGAFNGLRIAQSICEASPQAKVLMVSVELCTIHFQKSMALDNVISNAIFADGAAAVLIETSTQAKKYLSLESFYCDLLPQSSKEMAWQIGDDGFDIVLSSYVPEVIGNAIAQFRQNMLSQAYLTLDDISLYAIHPGGMKILQKCEEVLGIIQNDNRYAYEVLKDYGNMSSATILFVLKKILDDLKDEDHAKNLFSCAFGPGLTLESMLLKTHCMSAYRPEKEAAAAAETVAESGESSSMESLSS